jgi:rhodanese-related sulfurtransferase
MPITSLQPSDLSQRLASEAVVLIDVRSPAEFASCHVPGARNLPLDRLDAAAVAALPRNCPLHVICQGGMRSRKACEQLAAAGIGELVDITGGTNAWKAAGLPVEGTGGAVFGVERQVRSIIGGCVFAGAVLALTVHPYWAALSGFFGAGLLMAGLTNLCPLALAVAAMPWNRSAPVVAAGTCCRK